jgi:hypothetical protein
MKGETATQRRRRLTLLWLFASLLVVISGGLLTHAFQEHQRISHQLEREGL